MNTGAITNIGDPVSAIDPESAELTYALSDADSGLFVLDVSSDQISVRVETGLDYESPTDSDGDNTYNLAM